MDIFTFGLAGTVDVFTLNLCGRRPTSLPGVLVDEVRPLDDGVNQFLPCTHALAGILLQ